MEHKKKIQLTNRARQLMSAASINGIAMAPKANWTSAATRVDEFASPTIYGIRPVDSLNKAIPDVPFDPDVDIIIRIPVRGGKNQPLGGTINARVRFPEKQG